jgi:DNA-binding Lrp family transcriptional regulator
LIRGYAALLDDRALGYDVTAFAMVGLHSQAEADLIAFEERVRSSPIVRDCYMLSGEIDFMLKCVAPDLTRRFIILRYRRRVSPKSRNLVIRASARSRRADRGRAGGGHGAAGTRANVIFL